MNRKQKDKLAFYLSLGSGVLLISSGTNGVAVWQNFSTIVLEHLNFFLIKLLFFIAIIIASFGGISVILGGFLILKKKRRLGRIIILIAPGAGILSIFFHVFLSTISGNLSLSFFLSTATLGVILSILARHFSK